MLFRRTGENYPLTQQAYIANGTKSCFILQQITGRNCMTLIAAVYDFILPIIHVSLTLDGAMSFLRIIKIIHVSVCVTVKIFAGFFSVMAESWKSLKDTTAFSSFLVC